MARLSPVYCPQCQKKYRLPKSFENRQVVCKRCQHQFLVQSDASASSMSSGSLSSPFDSLDVEGLLNAPTSGLENAKPRAKRRKKTKRQKVAAPNPPTPGQAKASGGKARREQPADRADVAEPTDPDPGLIEEELEFAWAKKRKEKRAIDQQKTTVEEGSAVSGSGANSDDVEFDEEELAIYRAVTRQNRRRNIIWATIAAIAAISVAGFYAKQEYQLLGKPLSQAERDWLTDRGFVLEASHIAEARGGDGDGAAVMVAAGKSFADVDQFGLTAKEAKQNVGLSGRDAGNAFVDRRPNAAAPKRGNKRAAEPLPKVDFETSVDPSTLVTAAVKPALQIPFSGYCVATFSPRGHAYVAGSKFIKGVSADGNVFDQVSLKPTQTVTALLATADGRYLITGDDSGVVEAYRVDEKGRLAKSWKLRHIHRDKIIHLGVSNDVSRMVVYSADGRLSFWDLQKQTIELNLSDLVPDVRLSSFQITEDSVLISNGESVRKIRFGESAVEVDDFDKRYSLWATDKSLENIVVSDGRQISAIETGSNRPKWAKTIRIADQARIEFAPDGESAFYYDGGRDVLQFGVFSGRVIQRYGDDRLKYVERVAVSVDGTKLLTCGDSGSVLIYKIKGAKSLAMPKLKSPLPVPERVYPPDVTPSDDDVVAVATAKVTRGNVSAACLNNRGYLIAAEQGRTIVYDWTTARTVYERFESGKEKVTAMTTIGNRLVLGRSSGMVEVCEIESDGKLGGVRKVSGHIDPVKFITPIPKTALVASVTASGHTRVWDLSDPKLEKTVYVGKPIESSVDSVVVDRRSDLLLAAGDVLTTLDYKSGDAKQKKGEVRVKNVTLLPDGKRLAFFDRGKLKLATTSRGEVNLDVDLPKGAASVSFSPDSKLAFLFADEKVIVYRVRGGKKIFEFPIGSRSKKETEMVFSADKKFMMPFHRGSEGNFRIYATPSP